MDRRDRGDGPRGSPNRGRFARRSPFKQHARGPYQRKYPMGMRQLNNLLGKDPLEVTLALKSERSGFMELLRQDRLEPAKITTILQVVALACTCPRKENLSETLKMIHEVPTFLKQMEAFLRTVESNSSALSNLEIFLEELGKIHPILSKKTLECFLPLLKKAKSCRTLNAVHSVKLFSPRGDFEMGDTVPDDFTHFRDISVFPTCKDFVPDPYLKPNVLEGKYKSVEYYLDVQFRLFREDYVRPLRNSITSYCDQRAEGVQKNFKDVRVYRNVRLSEALFTVDSGIVHKVLFNYDGHIPWESSKRLIYGSLICLSTDGFKTFLVATVAKSKPFELHRGIVYIRFANEHMAEANKLMDRQFVAIETDAYFEAYRHVLTVLQEFEYNSFPLKEYIVYGTTEPTEPSYLSAMSKYCFQRPASITTLGELLIGLSKLAIHDKPKKTVQIECKCRKSESSQMYSALQTDSWPSATEFSLDHSQMEAFKLALTKKLSIIQGPPGTGKTHVGLRIVEALLHNQLYNVSEIEIYPILVVCFTNHALDQFLEGVLKLTKKVVRVGGRSSCESLEKHNLKFLKRNSNNDFTRSYRFQVRGALNATIAKIDTLQSVKNAAAERILSELELEDYLPYHHLRSLFRNHPECLDLASNPGHLIFAWLGSWLPYYFFIEYDQVLYLWFDEFSSYEELIPMLEDMVYSEILYKTFYYDVPWETFFPANSSDYVDEQPAYDIDTKSSMPIRSEEVSDVDFIKAQRMEDDEDILKDATVLYDTKSHTVDKTASPARTFVAQQLCCKQFSEIEATLCRNVWELRMPDRWRLYKYWLSRFHERMQVSIEEQKQSYDTKLKLYEELLQERERLVTQNFEVVGMTTTGAAKYKHLMRSLKPRIVIVEEAAEVMEAHVISSLNENTQHLILIGDHQQLRPNPACYELAKDYGLDISLFERLIDNGLPFVRLGIQHRMRPCISKLLVPHIYKELEDHSSVFEYEDVLGMERNMFFLSHTAPEVESNTSKSNVFEAEYLVALCRHLLLQGYGAEQITILATYLAQFALIKRLASKDSIFDGVKITVVDNYQGEENDIILLSFVRSNSRGSIGFLKTNNRVCVALSRAKKGLYCVGNFDLLAKESPLWRNIVSTLKADNAVGPEINTLCQIHGKMYAICEADDFINIPGGGCTMSCEFLLECGHLCIEKCHPLDSEHEKYKCQTQCEKVHGSCGHRCTKVCSANCGKCMKNVRRILDPCLHEVCLHCSVDPLTVDCPMKCGKILPCGHKCPRRCQEECEECTTLVSRLSPCGHTVKIRCDLSDQDRHLLLACTSPCTKTLPCGHNCSFPCGSMCDTRCSVRLERDLSCGHVVKIPCYQTRMNEHQLLDLCPSPCSVLLECGHVCRGSCGQCVQGRLHVSCNNKCEKKLVCGHVIKNAPCSRPYPPCREKCRHSCSHRSCPLPCGCPCLPCKLPCEWKCEHMLCSKTCGEPCDRPPCDQPCPKSLPCGHKCLGWCGEPCPPICGNCSTIGDLKHSKLSIDQISDTTDKLVLLKQCGHVFKWKDLKERLQKQLCHNLTIFTIKPLVCPICDIPFARIGSLGAFVHAAQLSVEQVKRKVFGSTIENNAISTALKSRIAKTYSSESYAILGKQFPEITHLVKRLLSQVSNQKRGIFRSVLVFTEIYISVIQELSKLCSTLLAAERKVENPQLLEFVRHAINSMTKAMVRSIDRVNPQLKSDLELEIQRLQLLSASKKDIDQSCSLLKCHRFQGLFKSEGASSLPDTTKTFVLANCMDYSRCNWYRCFAGHLFQFSQSAKEDFKCRQCRLSVI